ncbi:hypothetical protein CROQUDRAFT_37241 [Cronartium quercuum f. sp. fusiforme G11]|uniref:Ubiquitin-like domain-containing protein n=1 Tax=Cronartium quercuum f. sp. fusiforme G11 TaxID=708437 RepID=A0A9P6NS80_9BASI|nr:hypothetical protein CROQUDRAFT_37241 [Cronartium quercuum f. sp. fusiforme G11]
MSSSENPIRTESDPLAIPSLPILEINNGDQLTTSNSIVVSLLKPTAMESNGLQGKDELLRVHAFKTEVHQIKSHISTTWPGKPKIDGLRLIARGRVLNDAEVVNAAVSGSPGDTSPHPIHVVVRPNAWTEKITVAPMPARPTSAPPVAQAETGSHAGVSPTISDLLSTGPPGLPPPVHSLDPNFPAASSGPLPSQPPSLSNLTDGFLHMPIFTHFYNLTRPQRQAFVENLYKAQFNLVERLETLRLRLYNNQIDVLGLQRIPGHKNAGDDSMTQEEDERWKVVDDKLTKLLAELQYWGTYSEPYEPSEFQEYQAVYQNFQQSGPSEYERVEIGGLPFLLHIPRTFQMQAEQDAFLQNLATRMPPTAQVTTYKRLKKELNRTLHLEKRLQLLILQVKKLEVSFVQVDNLMASTRAVVSNLSLSSLGPPTTTRFQAVPQVPGAQPRQVPGAPAGHLGLVGMGAPNPNVGGAQAVPGMGVGLGPNGMMQMPAEWMVPPIPAPWPQPIAGRTRRYEFTINLDGLRRYGIPLGWLAFKLFLLLWIFGKHASFSKWTILIGLAVGWVLWEGFAIRQRHDAQLRRRERLHRQQAGGGLGGGPVDPVQAVLDRGRRRAERERSAQRLRDQLRAQRQLRDTPAETNDPNVPNLPPDAPANPIVPVERPPAPPAAPAPAMPVAEAPRPRPIVADAIAAGPQRPVRRNLRTIAEEIRARGGAFPPGTEVRPFRTTSAFSPKYWFNSIAVVGLASEYRELGLHPIGERAIGTSNNPDYPSWYKFVRNVKICAVLFIGTLLPEIEKKRKKALEKRARILKMVIADAARERETQAQDAAAAASSANTAATTAAVVPSASTVPEQSTSGPTPVVEVTTVKEESNLITPTVLSATGVDVGTQANRLGDSSIISRHAGSSKPPLDELPTVPFQTDSTSLNTPAPLPPSASIVQEASTSSATATTTPASEQPGTLEIPLRLGAGRTRLEDPESPLTPLNERPVVPGLDDTDDDDEIAGAGEEEAGMMLF